MVGTVGTVGKRTKRTLLSVPTVPYQENQTYQPYVPDMFGSYLRPLPPILNLAKLNFGVFFPDTLGNRRHNCGAWLFQKPCPTHCNHGKYQKGRP